MEQTRLTVNTTTWRWGLIISVGLLFLGWLINSPDGLLGKADAIGYAVCHRIDLRSFQLGDRQLPLCARCTGMYLGAVVGLVYQFILGKKYAGNPPGWILVLLAGFVLAFAVDGGNSYLTLILQQGLLYEPNNTLRLITGTGMGLTIAAALFPAFNQSVWRDWDPRAALSGFGPMVGLGLLSALVITLVALENSVLLYIFALVSAFGVLLLLTILYTLVLVLIMRRENCFESYRQLIFFTIAGFGIGLMQILLIDLGRFWLTGTWDGFHFG
jgi:uncharacterized membrane protein